MAGYPCCCGIRTCDEMRDLMPSLTATVYIPGGTYPRSCCDSLKLTDYLLTLFSFSAGIAWYRYSSTICSGETWAFNAFVGCSTITDKFDIELRCESIVAGTTWGNRFVNSAAIPIATGLYSTHTLVGTSIFGPGGAGTCTLPLAGIPTAEFTLNPP